MSGQCNKKDGSLYIGTSGWSYPHWAKGVFYPRSVPTQDWLKYYSSIFNAVEVNSTFYRLPNPSLLQKWKNITPLEFSFVIKIWRRISHELRLKNIQGELQKFHDSVLPLQEKTKVYLLQLPPSFIPTVELFDEFFQIWFDIFKGALLAVELRNKKSFSKEIFEIMETYNISICLEDYKGCELDNVITASWVYIRKHGPTGRYRGEYEKEQLILEAKKIKEWLEQGRDVFVFFNNDFGGYAPKNALQLLEFVRL